ncbi:unnamed protein product [Larinioides sclopetarius]|uniref:Uncharacterized protein n=1 Tax=Larinioides sclopetarius TaxID=280406 RepID=A0AAV2BGH0_9ARAC
MVAYKYLFTSDLSLLTEVKSQIQENCSLPGQLRARNENKVEPARDLGEVPAAEEMPGDVNVIDTADAEEPPSTSHHLFKHPNSHQRFNSRHHRWPGSNVGF